MMIKHNKSIFSEWKLSKNFVDTPTIHTPCTWWRCSSVSGPGGWAVPGRLGTGVADSCEEMRLSGLSTPEHNHIFTANFRGKLSTLVLLKSLY